MTENMIAIKHLRKEYPNVIPLKDINCEIKKGEVISIIGPSGTGKSTLLRCINRLENPTSGEILVNGISVTDKKTDIYKLRQRMGMVFQSFNLFSHLMVIENVMLGPVDLLKIPKQQAYDEAMSFLRLVGLAEKAYNYPDELSGGQKQRVAIARTLAMKPEIVLFDEPTSALDPTMVGEVLTVIRNLAAEGLTMLIVTHEMKFAYDVSTRIFYMDEGLIYEDGTPQQIFENPQKEKTVAFIKRLKTFDRKITTRDYDFIGMYNEFDSFAAVQLISSAVATSVISLFDELFMANVLPQLAENFEAHLSVIVSELNNQITMLVNWVGEEFNPLEQGDEISLKIAELHYESYKYEYKDGENKLYLVPRGVKS